MDQEIEILPIKQMIIDLLVVFDREAKFALSQRVDIPQYVEKLFDRAVIFPLIEQGQLKAFIAFYCNDFENKKGFVTILAVATSERRRGVGSFLTEAAMNYLRIADFTSVGAEVHKSNFSSFKMFEKLGFSIKEEIGDSYILTKELD